MECGHKDQTILISHITSIKMLLLLQVCISQKFISDDGAVVDERGVLYWGSWPEELKVSLNDEDEIRRRVYNIIKRMKEIKNKERMKNVQKDF